MSEYITANEVLHIQIELDDRTIERIQKGHEVYLKDVCSSSTIKDVIVSIYNSEHCVSDYYA